ncbi:L-aminoadipate-semialdehyde dehydrogenase [Drechslerella stenobrocha 248]|uniref:Alpha-aminoadipate reductase n=1 Tax=Drechslerella stenobrocha 248 TaxID=1043628 RepID=W7HVP2_9PEZI|nr:L-aminoadipate-semialdehyde dehydrogenase [Drechslerella stenobrocha 248]
MEVPVENLEPRLERWAERLKSLTTPSLTSVADYPKPAESRVVEAVHSTTLPESTRFSLLQLAITDGSNRASPFTILLAAFAILAFRITGDEDISLATSAEAKEPYVLRLPITGQTTFISVLAAVQKAEEIGAADAVPFSALLSYLQKKSKAKTPPSLFRLSLYHAPDAPSQQFLASNELNTDLNIYVELKPLSQTASLRSSALIPEITLSAHYNQLVFSKARISMMIEQLLQIVQTGAANPSIAVGAISLITPSQADILPDPKKNLNWGSFRGAIHDIFAANAKKHPERPCVVETPDFTEPDSVERVFTYRHIDEASNILAHHLIRSGIKLGDVVMVYAYRGVDLVVAVFGVLKAGGTFSVIDPQYPPNRQNIYLSVAKPKALVVIEKAGTLSPTVLEYIDAELSLVTQVPALAIQADGALLGGKDTEGKDVLRSYAELKSKNPGVIVGPDSNPTLSFTSGSEGTPKGVRGRHFSLTYYFPWMAETFQLSENDRFTMLSGIAHDPIQRDMFTPLFLGARLYVPTVNDIGTPGRLAEWMAENSCTVTHLTPAMGQLLSAQASAEIPSLHHAFFVGDILTKRDCLRLQTLARNVNVVNMYGTTETQRAVSYLEIPSLARDHTFTQSQKDVIAAGKGMLDVQLLVVNRHDRTQICGVGEVGELYVRAAGLAEGYLQLPELTQQKFVKNWFVPEDQWKSLEADGDEPWRNFYMGPRDRLYRSGDLGRYTPNGDVECSGRADDQVKIRGFRIELGEIDTHLSQHPLVRENVTLVKRDKDEEPTLVSYIVPLQNDELDAMDSAEDTAAEGDEDIGDDIVRRLRRYRRLIQDIKKYLATKLPAYAVPTVVVPLARMPLNPNGKVDKPALPALRDIWKALLPMVTENIQLSDGFFELGGHSILATRMIFEVRNRFAAEIPLGLVFKQPTLGALAAEVERIGQGNEIVLQPLPEPSATDSQESEYAKDARELVGQLPEAFESAAETDTSKGYDVFLTGCTGFLGAFLLRELLNSPRVGVYAHVRAPTAEKGLDRIKASCEAYGTWSDAWADRIIPIVGDLGKPDLGMGEADWKKLAEEVDFVIHNGAQVHWVYPYSTLRAANVLGTLAAIKLCGTGKPKTFAFVSSTSVLDNDHYVALSDTILERGGAGVPESDDLEGSSTGLGTGYGQSKWAAEYITREAGKRGLRGTIVRPGYVTGDTLTGVTNTDDFLVRMIKGCIQLGQTPDIHNTVNMVPVDHVARVVVASALFPPASPLAVAQVTSHPRLRFNEFLATLGVYGYEVARVDYIPWRIALEKHVIEISKDNALYPLLHFVCDNLPQSTKAPELDDENARKALEKYDEKWVGGSGVDEELMGVYLAYLAGIGFLEAPPRESGKQLPVVEIWEKSLARMREIGGRGAIVTGV